VSESRQDILHCIGNTSLLPLHNIVPKNGSRILVKLENENPTGSMKDRMALAMIEAAEADGRLTKNGSVVEYTGGSTGVSLSLVCAVKGYLCFAKTLADFEINDIAALPPLFCYNS
jgi:cysteine synthase A